MLVAVSLRIPKESVCNTHDSLQSLLLLCAGAPNLVHESALFGSILSPRLKHDSVTLKHLYQYSSLWVVEQHKEGSKAP